MAFPPERAWRIADRRHEIFDATGAFRFGGRWNSPGRRVIYAADSYAAALLEVLVHTRTGSIPRSQAWIEIEIPAGVSWEQLKRPEGTDPAAARQYGDEWHKSQRSLILVVPSVVTSGLSRNVLINQEHPEFRLLRASPPNDVLWDRRLFATA